MFTLFSFLGRKFNALSETSLRRLDYALRVILVLIAAMGLGTVWVVFHTGPLWIMTYIIAFFFVLFCVDMGVSLKNIRKKKREDLRCACEIVLVCLPIAVFGLFLMCLIALRRL